MEKEINNCTHHFEFVRTEITPVGLGGANMKSEDLVICTKCGLTKRV